MHMGHRAGSGTPSVNCFYHLSINRLTINTYNIMSIRRDYIPGNPATFNNWSETLYAFALAQAATIIPAAQMAAFTAIRAQYLPLWTAYSNEGTRTKQQAIDYRAFIKNDYVPFLRAFVQGYVVNNIEIPIGTRVGLGLSPRGANPRQAKPVIKAIPTMSVSPLGGGKVSFGFTPSGNKRTGILTEADGITLFFRTASGKQPVEVTINDGLVPLESVTRTELDGPVESYYSTKARFTLQFARELVGTFLEVYARWTNSSDPSKNGPFSSTIKVVIS